ncbi:Cruciform DNA binding protein [Coniosporium tulheliwenetii]|uniref:Cruciform DNA binding protein n=1 Tax=Coniosporium tulheliwenetii TaxID=3383036 RepID=A0ACC2Z797_9PEZI|nr:Cruciform DNA binding protein [Cladosporium sp. JES 115]
MGSYTFRWEHPANEVFVTGTFDDWSKSVRLNKKDNYFEKTVDLPQTNEKIYYKFVVDGNWVTKDTAPAENDGHYNYNNFLNPVDLQPYPSSHSHTMSSAAPHSTTSQLAGAQPREERPSPSDESMPGGFPDTPGDELKEFSVNPIPATSDAPVPGGPGSGNPVNLEPGEKVPDSSNFTDNTVSSTARDDPSLKDGDEDSAKDSTKDSTKDSNQTFGVAPIPASSGIGNPINIAPGEKVPDSSTFNRNTVESTARTDPSLYEKSDAGAPSLPPVITPDAERESKGGMFGLPSILKNLIPESSLPIIGTDTKDSSEPGTKDSTGVPSMLKNLIPESSLPILGKDTKDSSASDTKDTSEPDTKNSTGLPSIVKNLIPESSSLPIIGADKKDSSEPDIKGSTGLPSTLKNLIPESALPVMGIDKKDSSEPETKDASVPDTKDSSVPDTKDSFELDTKEPSEPSVFTQSAGPTSTTAMLAGQVPKEPRGVPQIVTDSQQQAHVDPEAAASPEAVREKKQLEQELLREVPKAPPTAESGTSTGNVGDTDTDDSDYAAEDRLPETAGYGQNLSGPSTGVATGESATFTSKVGSMETGDSAPAGSAIGSAVYATEDRLPETASYDQTSSGPSTGTTTGGIAGGITHGLDPEIQRMIDEMNKGHGVTVVQELNNTSNVPEPVAESYTRAYGTLEAAAYPGAVSEKNEVLEELLSKVPTTDEKGEPAPVTTSTTSATAAPISIPDTSSSPAPAVPEVVVESISASHASPEAAANPEAVTEKSLVEAELRKVIPQTNEAGEPAPTDSAALSATAPATTTSSALSPTSIDDGEPLKSSSEADLTAPTAPTAATTVMSVPPVSSGDGAHDEVRGLNAPADAPAQSAATETGQLAAQDPDRPSDTAGADRLAAQEDTRPSDSRDVSPMSKAPTNMSQGPIVTTGVGATPAAPSTTVPTTSTGTASASQPRKESMLGPDVPAAATPATPAKSPQRNLEPKVKGTPESARTSTSQASAPEEAGAEGKKSKRRSFFGKLKSAFK